MNWYKIAQFDNIIFFKFNDFNNNESKREMPYDGIHAWASKETDFYKILEIEGKKLSDVTIIDISDAKVIYGINYSSADFYITFPSYKEWIEKWGPYDNLSEQETIEYYEEELKKELPQLEVFNPKDHLMKITLEGYEPPWDKGHYNISNPYQILIIK